jgi:AraC-like DNA-binding protein
LNASLSTADYYHIWLALQSITKLDVAGRGLDMMIYYPRSDLILSPTFMAGRMSDAYDTFFRFGDADYSGFVSSFAVSSSRPMFFPAGDYLWESASLRGLLYAMRLQISGDTALYFSLREQYILDFFSPIFADRGALYIYDSQESLIFSHGVVFPPENVEAGLLGESGILPDSFLGPGITGAYCRSYSGLLYLSALETDTVLKHGRTLRNLSFALNAAAVLLSLVYALFLAVRSSRLVAEAFRLLDESPSLPSWEGGNILSYLNNSVSRLVNTNTLLREDADSRQEMFRAAFLDRLLSDGPENREEAAEAAEQAGINMTGRRFCVILLIMRSREDGTADKTFARARRELQSILEGALSTGEALIYSRNPSRMGVFFFLRPDGQPQFRDYIGQIFRDRVVPLCAEKNIRLHLVGSGLCEDLWKLREEYKLCREYALIHNRWEDDGIHWIDLLPPPRQQIFVFPLEAEQKLINQLQSADFEAARNSLRSVFAANPHESLLGENMLAILYAGLQGCFLKVLEGPLIDLYRDAIANMDLHRPSGKMEEDFTVLARQICASLAAEYSKKNAGITKEELITYVEDHFSEERLSLSLAARHFGFSEPYFSLTFKEITGENFSTLTEITRLNHARTLLKQYLKVEEVAYRCGYKSPGSFRRAFKRYFGITPTRNR